MAGGEAGAGRRQHLPAVSACPVSQLCGSKSQRSCRRTQSADMLWSPQTGSHATRLHCADVQCRASRPLAQLQSDICEAAVSRSDLLRGAVTLAALEAAAAHADEVPPMSPSLQWCFTCSVE